MKHVTHHMRGNIWLWIGGFVIAGAAAMALGYATPAAIFLMIVGILIVMADSHVDPLAIITEDALNPENAEIDQPPVARP